MISGKLGFEGAVERVRNYDKRTALKVWGLSTLGALTLALSACGDSGPEKIERCPVEYYRDHAPVKPQFLSNTLKRGTNALIFRIRRINGYGERDIALDNINPRYRAAAEDIFREDEEASQAAGKEVLIVGYGSSDTNVDEPGEIVCSSDGGIFYPTEAAETADSDLKNAGVISLEFEPSPLGN